MLSPKSVREIAPLILKYLRDEITDDERLRLNQWVYASEENQDFFENISIEKIIKIQDDFDEDSVWSKIQDRISDPVTTRPVPLYRKPFFKVAAAALIIIFIGGGAWLIWNNHRAENVATKPSAENYKNDVLPGGNKAILTLANGSTIILDSAQNGTLAQQGNAKIVKVDSGLLSYNSNTGARPITSVILYNSISTPKGGQYQVVLPDGSKAWLNAASSLRFPTSFAGKERQVELSGEAYFEIARDAQRPFKVVVPSAGSNQGCAIEVMGTHFNVNAYMDEREVKATLLEGSIKMTGPSPQKTITLKPGEQADLQSDGDIKLIPNADTDEVIAWKNGNFQFNDANIETIMRQVARWYDVEVVYEGKVSKTFVASISRNVPVSKLLRLLQLTNLVHFKIDGKKITVMP